MTKRRARGMLKRKQIFWGNKPVKYTRWTRTEYAPGTAEYGALTYAAHVMSLCENALADRNDPLAYKLHDAYEWLRDVFGYWIEDKDS